MPALAGYHYAFRNIAFHSEEWVASRIDGCIRDGLDYIAREGTFARSVEADGEPPPHHFFLERTLDLEEHPELRRQIAEGKRVNRDNDEWRMYFGMPGWPRQELTATDEYRFAMAAKSPQSLAYAVWFSYALYPRLVNLPDNHKRVLLQEPERLKPGYDLTHALMAYLWMREMNPVEAKRDDVDRLIGHVNARLYDEQSAAIATSDLYNERVAFFLYQEDGPPIRQRWIERIMMSQNDDGGWTFEPSTMRSIAQMFGLDPTGISNPHASFLAVYALTKYREQMRGSGAMVDTP